MRVWLLMGLSAAIVLLAADPTLASEGGEGPRSMFERALDLGIWTLVVFLLLLLVLSKYAWGPFLEGLDKRERDISTAVDEARKAKEETARLLKEIETVRQKANDEARQIRDEAQKAAETLKADMKAVAQGEIDAERDRNRRELMAARDQLVQDVMTQATDLGLRIAAKVIRREVTAADHRALADEAMAEFNQAAASRRASVRAGGPA